jgi:hypothetical protein
MLTLHIPALRRVQAIAADTPVRLAADRAERTWLWMMMADFAILLLGLWLMPRSGWPRSS